MPYVRKDEVLERDGEEYVRVDTAARLKGISAWALRKHVVAGTIETVKILGRDAIALKVLKGFKPDREKAARSKKAARARAQKNGRG